MGGPSLMAMVVARSEVLVGLSASLAVVGKGVSRLLVLLMIVPSHPLPAQQGPPSRPPPVFSGLEGDWEGSGTLLERPAAFEMSWEVGSADFVFLSFSNAWVGEGGETRPVLSARATYFVVSDSSALGVWVDDRPQRLTLDAVVTDSSVVTNWVAEAEKGRTEYLVRSPGVLVVRDYVIVDGADRLFAEASYRRAAIGRGR